MAEYKPQSDADLLDILDSSADGIAKLDRGWNLTFVNETARRMMAAAGSVKGKNLWQAFPGTVYEGSPWVEQYHRAMDEQVSVEFTAHHPAPLNMCLHVRVMPTRDGIISFFRDVTEQKKIERERDTSVRKSHAERERLIQVMAASRDAVTLIDRDWRITYLNPTTLGIIGTDKDFIGKDLWTCYPDIGEEGSPCLYHFSRAMNEGISASFEMYYPEPYNLPILIDVYPTDDGIVTFVRDISREKRAEAALVQNEKLAAVGRLAASIAHEINNPLESITNLLYLARQTEDAEVLKEYLSTAERELRRFSTISSQTLRFYRQSSKPKIVSGAELFESVLLVHQGRLVNSSIHVEKSLDAKTCVECYDGEIRQVLNNLIGNAIDAMQPFGGSLLIRTRDACCWQTGRKGLSLLVADTGRGMSSEVTGRLFEAFFTTKGIGGNGLGLWVSKEILDRHQGAVKVRSSQRSGATGTVFRIFLPAAAAARAH